jgi:hypothetical protein
MRRSLTLPFLLLALLLPHTVRASETQTLVLFRHAEKPAGDLGQLSCRGLNRALALPGVLRQHYGQPDFLFAPNPAITNHGFSYVRPLATIEPTAIALGMPVNTAFGFRDIAGLATELEQPRYRQAMVWIAWEHVYITELSRRLLTKYHADPQQAAEWKWDDFDGIAVITIQHDGNKTSIRYHHDTQGLNQQAATCPATTRAGSD